MQVVYLSVVVGYTGEGQPPTIEMTVRAANDKIAPHDLTSIAETSLTPTVYGVKQPNISKFEKEAQIVTMCVCQVFYRKIALNHWRARVVFFPKCHEEVTKTEIICIINPRRMREGYGTWFVIHSLVHSFVLSIELQRPSLTSETR